MRAGIVAVTIAVCMFGSCASAVAESTCAAPGGPAVNPATGKYEIDLGNCEGKGRQVWVAAIASEQRSSMIPDTNANYWVAALPSIAGHGAHWEVRGTMPDARFSSYQSYGFLDFVTMGTVPDERFRPDPGQVNWLDAGGRYPVARPGRYTLDIRQVKPSVQLPDSTLRLDADALARMPWAQLLYRVYANTTPNGSTPGPGLSQRQWIQRGQVPLPSIVYVIDDPTKRHFTRASDILATVPTLYKAGFLTVERTLRRAAEALNTVPNIAPALWSRDVRWEMYTDYSGALRNAINPRKAPLAAAMWRNLLSRLPKYDLGNANGRYVWAGVNPALGRLLVTRFKPPTAPEPDRGEPLVRSASSRYQVRYWSMCLYNMLTLYANGCIKDSEFKLDADGYATLVVSSTTSPPVGPDGRPAANWIRFGSPNEALTMRQTLPSPSFTNSLSFYTGDATDTAALRAWAGPYYPTSRYCSLDEFRADGCRG